MKKKLEKMILKLRIILEKLDIKNIFKSYLMWFISLLYLEFIFSFNTYNTYIKESIINKICFILILTSILSIITNIFKRKINKIITISVLAILGLLFSVQCIFYKTFKVYFSLFNIGLSDQLKDFSKELFKIIFRNIHLIIIFFIPLIFYIIFYKKMDIKKNNRYNYLTYLFILLISLLVFNVHINNTKNTINGAYDLYNNVNEVSLNVPKLGVINSYIIDLHRMIFGFNNKIVKVNLDNKKETINTDTSKDEKEEEIVYEDNILELNLDKETGNDNIKKINDYIKNDTPSVKNKYTGMFKDYNLIYITAESFSEIGVSKELTPTLYKMINSGFIFDKFYTPNNLSTIGGEFQTMTGLYPDSSILNKWKSGNNYYPYGLGTVFKNLDYNTYAYHNNTYVFQDRYKYMASQGFDNFLACYNGLEKKMNCKLWPQSDVEMMDVTIPDYINSDKPFMAYYMTVSGHFAYTFDDNSMSYKNRDLVKDLNVTTSARAYVATQIELDRALEKLISELEKAGKLDKTVIVLQADHYPYELDLDSINSLSDYNRDETIGVNHNALIIWNNKLEDIHITKPCMSIDVLPTVYNLFGIDYDSRLFAGRDILSSSFGIAIMRNRSWVSEKGTYYADNNKFVGEEIDEEYIRNVNNLINNRLNISKMIIANNYYDYLFN